MRRDYLILTGLALLFFFPFLGGVHLFDPSEIAYAECAREMLLTGEWLRPQMGFQPFCESPPMFLWAQAVSMQIFGINEFAARFPNAVCGLLTLLLVYRISFRLHDRTFAWLWSLAWLGSFLPHLYFRSGIVAPWFNLLVFCALYGFVAFRWQFLTAQSPHTFWQKYRWLLLGGGLLGVAMMTQGLAAYLVAMLVLGLYWARYRFRGKGYLKHLLLFSAASMLAVGAWLGLEIALHGVGFARQFAAQQFWLFSNVELGEGFFGVPAFVLLLGCFPASVFALPNLWGDRQSEDELLESDTLAACKRSDFATWMQLLFWTVFLLFGLLPTNAAHFVSLCFFPLTYLGAVTIWRAVRWGVRPKAVRWLLPGVGVLLGVAVAAVPWAARQGDFLKTFFADNFFALAALQAEVRWEIWHTLLGLGLAASSLAGVYFWQKNRSWSAAQLVFGSGAAFTALAWMLVVCNIEAYAQRAAIDFYKSKCGEPCTVQPVGFETRAHLFYACQTPDADAGKIYFVAKCGDLGDLPNTPGCRELYRKNGYVFFEQQNPPTGAK